MAPSLYAEAVAHIREGGCDIFECKYWNIYECIDICCAAIRKLLTNDVNSFFTHAVEEIMNDFESEFPVFERAACLVEFID